MNPSQLMILESFAGAQDEQEINELMDVLRNFYADRLEREMQRLWDNGTLDEKKLEQLRGEHLRTPYRIHSWNDMKKPTIVLDTNCLLQILGAKSKYHFLFGKFLSNDYTMCVSTEILFEYEEILRQKASPQAADLFMKVIARSRNVVKKDPFYHLSSPLRGS